jgi:hypothetical protein
VAAADVVIAAEADAVAPKEPRGVMPEPPKAKALAAGATKPLPVAAPKLNAAPAAAVPGALNVLPATGPDMAEAGADPKPDIDPVLLSVPAVEAAAASGVPKDANAAPVVKFVELLLVAAGTCKAPPNPPKTDAPPPELEPPMAPKLKLDTGVVLVSARVDEALVVAEVAAAVSVAREASACNAQDAKPAAVLGPLARGGGTAAVAPKEKGPSTPPAAVLDVDPVSDVVLVLAPKTRGALGGMGAESEPTLAVLVALKLNNEAAVLPAVNGGLLAALEAPREPTVAADGAWGSPPKVVAAVVPTALSPNENDGAEAPDDEPSAPGAPVPLADARPTDPAVPSAGDVADAVPVLNKLVDEALVPAPMVKPRPDAIG